MSAVIVTTPAELRSLIGEEVRAAVAAAIARKRVAITDLAAELGVSVPTVRRMESDGRLPPRDGRHWDRATLDRWLADRGR